MKNKLEKMFEQQKLFMNLLQEKRKFPDFPFDLSKKENQKFIKDISYEAVGELFEAIQHLKNSKMHRSTELPHLKREEYLEEIVDCVHYIFEILIMSGFDCEEFYDAYIKKGEINTKRILNDY